MLASFLAHGRRELPADAEHLEAGLQHVLVDSVHARGEDVHGVHDHRADLPGLLVLAGRADGAERLARTDGGYSRRQSP